MMKKLLTLVLALMVMAAPAWAIQVNVVNGYYTVAWQLPHAPTGNGADAPWPQTFVAYAGPFTQPNLGAVDGELDCGWYQVDVYKIDSERDQDKLEWILGKETLNWPEDSSIYYSSKFVEEKQCGSETTTTIGTTTTSEGSTTTTTTRSETTTTTSGSTTTSTNQPSSSIPATSSTASTPTPPNDGTLPFTGVGDWIPMAVIGGLALGLIGGLVLLAVGRREVE